ncbi:MAG: carbohydrate deacetylase [Planctomycetota bacterium]
MISVILSGDDFGLAPAINEGIALAHARGCLTSASLSVAGPAAEDAASRARGLPSLGVGLHLTLVAERPVSRAADVPTLVGRDGRFPPSAAAFASRWLSRRIRPEQVRREVRAQLEKARELGLSLTHLDSHQHVHVLPGLIGIVLGEMGRSGLRRLRIPLETARWPGAGWGRRAQRGVLNGLARRAARLALRAGFAFPDRFLGFLGAGRVDADGLLARIDALEDGVTEIGLHPAAGAGLPREDFASWGYRWSGELDALLDPRVREVLDRRGIRRVNYEACSAGEGAPGRRGARA